MADEVISSGGGSSAPESNTNFSTFFDNAVSEPEQADTTESTDPEPVEDALEETPEPEVEAEAAEPEAEAQTEQPAEESEDYSIRERNGKKEMVFPPSRGEMIYGSYKAAQAAEQVFGEPLTKELAQERQAAFVDREAMIGDFFTPGREANVLGFLADIAQQGYENGEIAHDPIVNLAARFPSFVQGNPAAFEALAKPVLEAKIEDLYERARQRVKANPQDDGLLESVRWIEKELLDNLRPRDKALASPDPVDARLKQAQEAERRVTDHENRIRQQELQSWGTATNTEIKTTVVGVIDSVLTPVAEAYKQFPREFQAIKDSLDKELKQALKSDSAWKTTLENAQRRAHNAASPSVRESVKADLVARYKAKAAYLLDPVRNQTVKDIIASRATQVKAQSDASHKRLANAAAKREPNSPGGAVKQNAGRIAPNGAGANAFKAFFDTVVS